MVRPTPACFHLLGKENISPPRKKTWFTDTDRKKCYPTSMRIDQRSRFKKEGSPDDADRTFPIRLDIIQILFSDWIENTIADVGRCKVATDIFLPTLHNFFYKRWPIIFFDGRGWFFVRCCRKNLQCWSARFFRSSSTEVVFRPTTACFHLLGMESINQPRQKNMIPRYWMKKMLADVCP